MNVGDRVIIKDNYYRKDICGLHGTIIYITSDNKSYAIQFDQFINGHDGGFGIGKNGYCWNVSSLYVESEKDDENKDYQPRIRWYKNGKFE